MRIQHNIAAMTSYRNFNNNTNALSKNLEKLSSGYRINRAGDDAAGLAISEKMRAQITGLDAAQKNVKDGISLVKTAEGAMQEIQDMMNRMKYLATQSANGTYQNEVDRENLQKEVDALKTEINRIADSSNFNGKQLLDGSLTPTIAGATDLASSLTTSDAEKGNAATKGVYTLNLSDFVVENATTGATTFEIKIGGVTVGTFSAASAATTGSVQTTKLDNSTFSAATGVTIGGVGFTVSFSNGSLKLEMTDFPTVAFSTGMTVAITAQNGAVTGINHNGKFADAVKVQTAPEIAEDWKEAKASFALTADMVKDGNKMQIGNNVYTFKVGKDSKVGGSNVIDLSAYEVGDSDLLKAAANALSKQSNSLFELGTDGQGTVKLVTKDFGKISNDLVGTTASGDADWTGLVQWAKAGSGESTTGLTLQIGDTADGYNQLTVAIDDMHTDALGIGNLDISTLENAQASIEKITDAINKVSQTRGDLGAIQNRLEHTQNNLSVMEENIQDAESTIRDTDMADEMTTYTKNNILIQAAQAMLAQANQQPQGVLQLLQ